MNIDKYNDAIKQKLESIEPKFEEQDWNEMQSLMAINAPQSNVLEHTLLYSAGIILLLSSLFFNFKQNNELQSLLENNKILIEKNHSKPVFETKNIDKRDTVYLTKYITKWRTVERIVNVEKVDNQIVSVAQQHPSTTATPVSQPLIRHSDSKGEFSGDTNKFMPNSFQISETNSILVNEKKSEGKSQNINTLNSISSIQNPFVWNKNLPEVYFKSRLSFPDKRKQITIKLPSFANVKYRVGVSFDVGNEQIGGSILTDFLLNKHWSMNAGLRLMNITGMSYYTAEQYLFATKQDFRQLYAPYVPANFDLINLDFEHYLLQIPIGISYRYPIRNDFTLLFSATTDLDLYVRQHINFDYKQDNSQFVQGRHKSILSNNFLNNFEFSAGIEKKYNRMIFQIHPYFSTQLKETIYKKEQFVFGAKMRFFVNLR